MSSARVGERFLQEEGSRDKVTPPAPLGHPPSTPTTRQGERLPTMGLLSVLSEHGFDRVTAHVELIG